MAVFSYKLCCELCYKLKANYLKWKHKTIGAKSSFLIILHFTASLDAYWWQLNQHVYNTARISNCTWRITYSWVVPRQRHPFEGNPFLYTCKTSFIKKFLPTTVGSRSTNTARGTCFPAPVSAKNVLKESSPPPMVLSLGIWPSGWIPCSKQYNSQQAFPIWTPAWPTWTEIHSRCKKRNKTLTMSNLFPAFEE